MLSQPQGDKTSLLGNSPTSAFTLCSTQFNLSTTKSKEQSCMKAPSASTYVSPSGLVQQLVLQLLPSIVTSEQTPPFCQTMASSVPPRRYDPQGQEPTCLNLTVCEVSLLHTMSRGDNCTGEINQLGKHVLGVLTTISENLKAKQPKPVLQFCSQRLACA